MYSVGGTTGGDRSSSGATGSTEAVTGGSAATGREYGDYSLPVMCCICTKVGHVTISISKSFPDVSGMVCNHCEERAMPDECKTEESRDLSLNN